MAKDMELLNELAHIQQTAKLNDINFYLFIFLN